MKKTCLLILLLVLAAASAWAQDAPPIEITGLQVKLFIQNAQGFVGTVTVLTNATEAGAGRYLVSLSADGKPLLRDDYYSVPAGEAALPFYGLTFPELRTTSLTAKLVMPGKPQQATLTQDVVLTFDPLTVDVTSPFYARCIFPTQNVPEIRGTVTINLPAEQRQGATLMIALAGPGLTAAPLQKPAAGPTVDFAFDATGFQVGTATLSFTLTRGGQTLAEKQVTVRKLPKPPGSCVWIDENLNTVWNGQPLFPLIWHGAYGLSTAVWTKYSQPRCDWALERPETGVVLPGGGPMEAERIDPAEVSRVTMDVVPSQKVFDSMLKTIEAGRKSTALFYYYLSDEPECRGLSPVYLQYQYDFIKEHDPYHPVMIITRDPKRFTNCADILSPHPYLNPIVDHLGRRRFSSPPQEIADQMRDVLEGGKRRIPAWLTPQAFTYSFQDPQAQYPTFREWNMMFWTGVANGCQGMTPFFYAPSFGSIDLRLGIPWTFETVGALQHFWTSFEKPVPVTVTGAPENAVDTWMKTVNGESLLIAVNLTDQPVHATLASPALQGLKELHGVREEFSGPVRDGKLELDFAPYQVHLLSDNPQLLPENGDGVTTVEKLQELIDRSNAALLKPGNLLAGKGREDIAYSCSDTYVGADYSLTDGITDMLGFKQVVPYRGSPWVEMAFLNFKPTFRTVKLYTPTVGGVEFWAWIHAKWEKVAEVQGHNGPVITLELPDAITTVKVRIVMTAPSALGGWGSWPQSGWGTGGAELYEVELYN